MTRRKESIVAVLLLLLIFSASTIFAGFGFQASVSSDNVQVSAYYLALEQYTSIPQKEFVVVKRKGFSDEELPVLLFIASKANCPVKKVMNMRNKGMKWWEITTALHLNPELFYVPVKKRYTGTVYGNYYNYYSRPKNGWKAIVLSDEDMINSVNLRFVSDHYGYDTDYVIKMRDNGKSFIAINDELRMQRVKERSVKWRARDIRGNENYRDERKEDNKDFKGDIKGYKDERKSDKQGYKEERKEFRKEKKEDKR